MIWLLEHDLSSAGMSLHNALDLERRHVLPLDGFEYSSAVDLNSVYQVTNGSLTLVRDNRTHGERQGALAMPTWINPPQAAAEAAANLAQRIGASQLTEQAWRRPAGKALGITLSGVLLYECGELGAGKVLEQLIE